MDQQPNQNSQVTIVILRSMVNGGVSLSLLLPLLVLSLLVVVLFDLVLPRSSSGFVFMASSRKYMDLPVDQTGEHALDEAVERQRRNLVASVQWL